MMTMLEKAARSLYELGRPPEATDEHRNLEWSEVGDLTREKYRCQARAVLMSLRDPDETLSRAVQSTEGWEAMIDAILNEGDQP